MDGTTSLLFGLDKFCVVDVVRVADRLIQVIIETVDRQRICPQCGRPRTRVKDREPVRIRDLPLADQQVACGGASGGCVMWAGGRTKAPRRSLNGRTVME